MNPLIFWIDEIHGDAAEEVVIDGKAEKVNSDTPVVMFQLGNQKDV